MSAQTYRGNRHHEWESVATGTFRLRVPGGWLYRFEQYGPNIPTLAFVPMPEVVKHAV